MIGHDFARQNAHQRRLARAIAAEQADAIGEIDLARDAFQQRRAAKTHRQIIELQEWHGTIGRPGDQKRSILAEIVRQENLAPRMLCLHQGR